MNKSSRLLRLLGILAASLSVFFACHLNGSQESEETFTFPTLKDSIGAADSVLIVLKDQGGRVVDTLFHDKVSATTKFMDLKAPHYDGGKVFIFIEAIQDGKLVYKVERGFDPALGGNIEGTRVVYVTLSSGLRLDRLLAKLREGDSGPLPEATIVPQNLSDKSLLWTSRNPLILKVEGQSLKALTPGFTHLVAALKADTSKRDSLLIEVISRIQPVKPIDSLLLVEDTLTLALGGPAGFFNLRAIPSSASLEASWSLVSGASVLLAPDGLITPAVEGLSLVAAVSKLDGTVSDTAVVHVLPRQRVDSLRFIKDSLDLFVGGAAELLNVRIHPALAPQGVALVVRDTSLARVANGSVQALKEGETWVVASSTDDPSKQDSVKAIIYPSEKVDSVRLKEDTLKLYVNGESQSLTASIHPATLKPRFHWRSGQGSTASVDASGKVTPGKEGKTFVAAIARADSTKKDSTLIIVKRDTPRLKVGGDTLIAKGSTLTYAPEAPQEYGLVVMLKWDLNGDGVYEDSAKELRAGLSYVYSEAKTYPVRFYVRDTEGNDTTVIRKVTAVSGRVVQIISPKDEAYVNTTPITITWNVDGQSQSNSQGLIVGANTIARSAKDSAGTEFSHSITVYLDQSAPNRPDVKGPTLPVSTFTPQWTWSSGGNGGNGNFRLRLDNPDLSASPTTRDTFFTPVINLADGPHTLFVQERDEAGNWSESGQWTIRIDTAAPKAPTVTLGQTSPTRELRPTWNWTGGLGDAHRFYRYKLDNDDFRAGSKDTTGTSFRPLAALSNGTHTLYVQERDSAGNWSTSGFAPIVIDTARPEVPAVSGPALTNDSTPTWTWTTATTGTVQFRYRLDNPDLSTGATTTTQKEFTPAANLTEGVRTLYVQVGDAAGNWSDNGFKAIRLDLTKPSAPRIDSTPYSPLNSLRPKFTWRSGLGGAKIFRARINNADLSGSLEQNDSSLALTDDLPEGAHTIYAQERDSAGNWSSVSARKIFLSLQNVYSVVTKSTSGTSIAIRSDGVPFIAVNDPASSDAINLYHYSNGSWQIVGPATLTSDKPPFLVSDTKGNILVGQRNIGPGYRPSVAKYNGSSWQDVGGFTFDTNYVESFTMVNNASDVLYSAYVINSTTISARKYNGSSWLPLTPADDIFVNSFYHALSPALSANGTPYLAIMNNSALTVRKFTGSNWEVIGTEGLANGLPREVSLGFTGADEPIVGFADADSDNKLAVRKFDGNRWVPVGSANISSGISTRICLKVSKSGKIVVAYLDQYLGATNLRVQVFHDNQWLPMGNPVNVENGDHLSLAVDENDVPFVSFHESSSVKVLRISFNQ